MEHAQLHDPALEAQFNLRLLRPDFEAGMLKEWQVRSARLRRAAGVRLGLAYGPDPRERLDFFPAAGAAAGEPTRADTPLLVFFHGGYWQRGDKSAYSFLARPFARNGVAVALVNYTVCPGNSVEGIVQQCRRALAWLWRQAPALGCARERCFVGGHSAGGQIAARLMATDWPALGADLPQRMLSGALLVSAVFDLEPLCRTSLNRALGLDPHSAHATSPMAHAPATDAPQLLAVGTLETAPFAQQADAYARAFGNDARPMPRYRVEGCDHFDVLQALADPHHPFFLRALAFIEDTAQPTMQAAT